MAYCMCSPDQTLKYKVVNLGYNYSKKNELCRAHHSLKELLKSLSKNVFCLTGKNSPCQLSGSQNCHFTLI